MLRTFLLVIVGRRYVLLVLLMGVLLRTVVLLPPYARLRAYRVFLFLKRGILAGKPSGKSGVTISVVWYAVCQVET